MWMDAQYAAHAAHAVDPSVLDASPTPVFRMVALRSHGRGLRRPQDERAATADATNRRRVRPPAEEGLAVSTKESSGMGGWLS